MFLVLLLCFCFALSTSAQSAHQHKKSASRKTAQPVKSKQQQFFCELPPGVNSIAFDKEQVYSACSDDQGPDSARIEVRASGPEGDELKYVYTVSGGTIVGNGPTVIWDLAGATPGTYSITAGIEFDAGAFGRQVWGKTITKLAKVLPCEGNQP